MFNTDFTYYQSSTGAMSLIDDAKVDVSLLSLGE